MRNRAVKPKKTEEESAVRSSGSAMPEGALFLLTAVSIVFFGLIMLYSTSYVIFGFSYFTKQMIWAAIGFAAMAGTVLIGYRRLCGWSFLFLILCIGLLALALFFKPIKGAHRWILLGPFSIQPSEFAKVTLVLLMSWFLAGRPREIETASFLKVMVPIGLLAGPMIALVLLGKDLGTTILLGSVFLIMLFIAGVKIWYLLPFILVFPPLGVYLIVKFDPERLSRLTTFLDPELTASGDGYQLWNSLLALGSGGWQGIGFTESRIKLKYLPEAHTDFILSIVGEELGFISLLCVLAAYMVFAFAGLRIGCKARTRQGMFISFGMISFIMIQAFINIGVISGALPTKGMPAPLISYGGSNLVASLIAVGCVFSVAVDTAYPDYADGLLRFLPFFRGKTEEKKKKSRA